jgi:hypothetical protein
MVGGKALVEKEAEELFKGTDGTEESAGRSSRG